jgi:hypothetical protein
MKVHTKVTGFIFLFCIVYGVAVFLIAAPNVYADPTNQSIIQAEAGNVTELLIFGSQQSNHWAGAYGNITGLIVLDDAQNWSMYQWGGITNPEGEIYAANGTVSDWGSVMCMNLSSNQPSFNCTGQNEECSNLTEIETFFGMTPADADGIDETFNSTLDMIMVGTKPLYNCQKTNLYVNDTIHTENDWNETILTVNNTPTVIFAGILQNDAWGYNNETWDFQLMIADDGSDAVATPYYMYVELS